jgi:short-subunit dehydrogenase
MNRTALITGATRGIGCEVARQLSELGFRVYVTGRDEVRLHELMEELGCAGGVFDLAEADGPVRLYAAARAELGRVDVLVNNAGFNKAKDPIGRIEVEDLDLAYAVNTRAPILLAREAMREMGERGSGHIVNILSSIVRVKAENYSVYSMTKYAMEGFTGCLIKEARQVGVKVTAVYPGGVDTDFRPNARPDYMKPESAARMIVQSVTAPEDVVVHEIVYRPMVETNF